MRKSKFEGNLMISVQIMLSLRCLCAIQTDIKQLDIINLKMRDKEINFGLISLSSWCLKLLYSEKRREGNGRIRDIISSISTSKSSVKNKK